MKLREKQVNIQRPYTIKTEKLKKLIPTMKKKQMLITFTVFATLLFLLSCGESPKRTTASDIQVSPAKGKDNLSVTLKEYKTKTGKTVEKLLGKHYIT